jgi:CheY-like chemotaxis protein
MSPLGKVLFVDDEANILRSLKRAFFQSDFESHFAGSGAEALEILAIEPIDILVTDIRMPGIDGLQLLKKTKEDHPGIHRIVLSGFVEERTVLAALNSGLATTHFGKPWNDRVLEERLLHLLETPKIPLRPRSDRPLRLHRQLPHLLHPIYGAGRRAGTRERGQHHRRNRPEGRRRRRQDPQGRKFGVFRIL